MKNNNKSSKSQYKEGEGSFSPSFKIIENNLRETIVSVEDLNKLYGSKSNNSMVTTFGNRGGLKRYVLKCASLHDITNEVTGTKAIGKFLPVSKIVIHSLKDRKAWLLREYVPGVLMADITNHFEPLKEVGCLQELEIKKEGLVIKGYAKSTKKLNLEDYLNLASNKLFYQRLVGERYKKFYTVA